VIDFLCPLNVTISVGDEGEEGTYDQRRIEPSLYDVAYVLEEEEEEDSGEGRIYVSCAVTPVECHIDT